MCIILRGTIITKCNSYLSGTGDDLKKQWVFFISLGVLPVFLLPAKITGCLLRLSARQFHPKGRRNIVPYPAPRCATDIGAGVHRSCARQLHVLEGVLSGPETIPILSYLCFIAEFPCGWLKPCGKKPGVCTLCRSF